MEVSVAPPGSSYNFPLFVSRCKHHPVWEPLVLGSLPKLFKELKSDDRVKKHVSRIVNGGPFGMPCKEFLQESRGIIDVFCFMTPEREANGSPSGVALG